MFSDNFDSSDKISVSDTVSIKLGDRLISPSLHFGWLRLNHLPCLSCACCVAKSQDSTHDGRKLNAPLISLHMRECWPTENPSEPRYTVACATIVLVAFAVLRCLPL